MIILLQILVEMTGILGSFNYAEQLTKFWVFLNAGSIPPISIQQKKTVPLSKLAQRATVKKRKEKKTYNGLLKPTAFHTKGTSGPILWTIFKCSLIVYVLI